MSPDRVIQPRRSWQLSLALILGTIVTGLMVRFAALGLPPRIVKYGGSALWALMVYWILSTLLPARRPGGVVLLAGCLATAVELGKLLHTPSLDAFRHTLPGILLLGRIFNLWDIGIYWLAIVAGAILDRKLCQGMGK